MTPREAFALLQQLSNTCTAGVEDITAFARGMRELEAIAAEHETVTRCPECKFYIGHASNCLAGGGASSP